MKNPVHPGEYLKEAYMIPLKLTNQKLADAICVTPSTMSRLVSGKADLSVEMSMRLSKALGNSAQQWLNIQNNYTLSKSGFDLSKVKKLRSK